MKRYLALLLAGTMAFSAAGCGGSGEELVASSTELNIYMWQDYISENLIRDFEEQNGCTVTITAMPDRETSFEKLQAGCEEEFDLVMTSTKYVAPLIDEEYVEKINMENVPDSSCIIDKYWLSKSYTVPYLMKYVYVIYDAEKCPVEIDHYKDLLSEELKGQVAAPDDMDVLFPMALDALGLDPNSVEDEDIEKAGEWLLKFRENMSADGTDAAKALLKGMASVAVTDDRVAAEVMAKNKNIKIAEFTKSKVQLDTDIFVIPKDAVHKDLAERFLNYICNPEVMAENLKEFNYACPNDAAVSLTAKAYREEPSRQFEFKKNIFFRRDISEAQNVYDRCAEMLKTEPTES